MLAFINQVNGGLMVIKHCFWKAICALGITFGALGTASAQEAASDYFTSRSSSSQVNAASDTLVAAPEMTFADSSASSQVSSGVCGQPCDSYSSCGEDCCCDDPLLGFILPTDQCFCDFISPMTNPVYFEDPRNLSELRFIFLNHITPPALGADSVRLLAMQIRAKLTERLSVIATKDGFIMSDSPLMNDGWADVNAGLKYLLYSDCETQTLLSAGLTYTLPVGSTRSLQARGDGEFHLFLTGGTQLGEKSHWISASGFVLPSDASIQNKMFYFSNHLDRKVLFDNFYVFGECNWYNYLSSAQGFNLPVEGGDLINLGSTGIAGNDIVTGAFGFKYKWNCWNELGLAWEVPLTERRGVLDNRLTVDYILRW